MRNQSLEDESIHILRETVAQFENPVMLYSAGKDSSVMARLARKAFYPSAIPFPFLHIDTGMKFEEMYAFRDRFALETGVRMLVHREEESIAKGAHPSVLGTQRCCSLLKTKALLDALREQGFDAAIGGARRDEEKSRAKERIFSYRDRFGQWDAKNQRPELWNLFNGRHEAGECFRVFPLSNWTELDIWRYIQAEKIPIVPLYFAKERQVVVRGGQCILHDGSMRMQPGEKLEWRMCRFRTLGCSPCTGAVLSDADTIEKIVDEISCARNSERITRVIDHDRECSMERKKQEGYF